MSECCASGSCEVCQPWRFGSLSGLPKRKVTEFCQGCGVDWVAPGEKACDDCMREWSR